MARSAESSVARSPPPFVSKHERKDIDMADETEGCLGCLGLMILGGIVLGVIAAVQTYVAAIQTERVLFGLLTAVPTGLAAGALVALIAGSYRKKSALGPLPYVSYCRSTSGLRGTYLKSSVPPPSSDENTTAEDSVEAEIVEGENDDAQEFRSGQPESQSASTENCPKCGFSFKWDGTRCGHCHYTAPSN